MICALKSSCNASSKVNPSSLLKVGLQSGIKMACVIPPRTALVESLSKFSLLSVALLTRVFKSIAPGNSIKSFASRIVSFSWGKILRLTCVILPSSMRTSPLCSLFASQTIAPCIIIPAPFKENLKIMTKFAIKFNKITSIWKLNL